MTGDDHHFGSQVDSKEGGRVVWVRVERGVDTNNATKKKKIALRTFPWRLLVKEMGPDYPPFSCVERSKRL